MSAVHLQVCIRCRPFASKDKLGVIMKEEEDGGNSSIELLSPKGAPYGQRWGFTKAWWSGHGYEKYTDELSQSLIKRNQMKNITQEEVYKQVGIKMKSQFLNGHAVVMFAYGLSGSGKTFSVFGPDMVGLPEAWFNFDSPHRFWGVFPRLAFDIMTIESKKSGRSNDWNFSMKYFQNVVDRIWDLLSGENDDDDDDDDNDDTNHEKKIQSHHMRRASSMPSFKGGLNNGKMTSHGKSSKVEDRHINDGFHQDAHGFVDITWCRKKAIQSWADLIRKCLTYDSIFFLHYSN
jgi:hypothetical protein